MAADGKLDARVELPRDGREMKAKVSIVRTDPFTQKPIFQPDGSQEQVVTPMLAPLLVETPRTIRGLPSYFSKTER